MKLSLVGRHPSAQPDPFVLEENGRYYIFTTATGTEKGVHCYLSDALQGPYRYLGIVFSLENAQHYWAPAVMKAEGRYWMYVSIVREGEEDMNNHFMVVAVSAHPEGPYHLMANLLPPFSIDAEPVKNDAGMFLFYSLNDAEAPYPGTRIVVDRLLTPYQLAGKPHPVVEPSLEEEIFQKDRYKVGQDWHTIEGACYFYLNGIHFLLYSAGRYETGNYFVAYASASTNEQDLTKISFIKYPSPKVYSPLLASNAFESGTGHNSHIEIAGAHYLIYHGRDLSYNGEGDGRTMRIALLHQDGARLWVERRE